MKWGNCLERLGTFSASIVWVEQQIGHLNSTETQSNRKSYQKIVFLAEKCGVFSRMRITVCEAEELKMSESRNTKH